MPKLFIAICVVALIGAGCEKIDYREFIMKYHDAEAGVTCWNIGANAISCVPDSQLK